MSKIEWTGKTWNPTIGCTEVSRGCLNCYAAKMAYRLMHIPAMAEDYAGIAKRLPNGRIVFTGLVKELPDRLKQPISVKKPTLWFVNSMSDLFHPDVTFNFLYKVFEVMLLTPHHTYQVLTKQPDRASKMMNDVWFHLKRNYPGSSFPLKNVWGGVSCEDQKSLDARMFDHLSTDWHLHFLSYEPAVGEIDLLNIMAPDDEESPDEHYTFNALSGGGCYTVTFDDGTTDVVDGPPIHGLKWVICGGESGTGKTLPMHPDWARRVRNDCRDEEIPFFFKQWGNWHESDLVDRPDLPASKKHLFPDGKLMYNLGKDKTGHLLDGQEYFNYPNKFIRIA